MVGLDDLKGPLQPKGFYDTSWNHKTLVVRVKFFNNFENRQLFWLWLIWAAVPGEKMCPYFTILCCSFSMPAEEQFPKSCWGCSSYFIFCGVSQYAALLWLSVRLILRKREMVGFQSLKLFFLLLPFQANCSVSRILSQQAAASAVAQVFFLVCPEILPINFMMLPVWIPWPFQCHCTANCLMADLFFFFSSPQRDCNILDLCTENSSSSAWVSCCSLFFYSTQFVVDSGFHAPLLSAASSPNIWTCIFLHIS